MWKNSQTDNNVAANTHMNQSAAHKHVCVQHFKNSAIKSHRQHKHNTNSVQKWQQTNSHQKTIGLHEDTNATTIAVTHAQKNLYQKVPQVIASKIWCKFMHVSFTSFETHRWPHWRCLQCSPRPPSWIWWWGTGQREWKGLEREWEWKESGGKERRGKGN